MKSKFMVPVVILLVMGMVFYMNLGPPMPEGYADFQAVEAQSQLAKAKDVHILDVRTPAEFNSGHIAKAQNIDFHGRGFEDKLKALDKDAQYLIYCRTGNRSASTLKMMHKLGFTKVWHMSDGISDWNRAGLPVVK